jgi:hypothetical protein
MQSSRIKTRHEFNFNHNENNDKNIIIMFCNTDYYFVCVLRLL